MVKFDYVLKGVQFFYIYKLFVYLEFENYISFFIFEEWLMYVVEVKCWFGLSVIWFVDMMCNDYYEMVGCMLNSEFVFDVDVKVVVCCIWSNLQGLCEDFVEFVGVVEFVIEIDSFDLLQQDVILMVVKGIVLCVLMLFGVFLFEIEFQVGESKVFFYVKLCVEGMLGVFEEGNGMVYFGFYFDLFYKVYWNNEVDLVLFSVKVFNGVIVMLNCGVVIDLEELVDVDFCEFFVEVDGVKGDVFDV